MNATLNSGLISKVKRGFEGIRLALQSFYHEQRLQFVVGLTRQRFAFAKVYVNGRCDSREPKTFEQLRDLLRLICARDKFPQVDEKTLLRMWCSRREIRFQVSGRVLSVVTYWNF